MFMFLGGGGGGMRGVYGGKKKRKKTKKKPKDSWFEALTADQCKGLLRALKQPLSGSKADLVQRLQGNEHAEPYDPPDKSYFAPKMPTIKATARAAGVAVSGKKYDLVLRILAKKGETPATTDTVAPTPVPSASSSSAAAAAGAFLSPLAAASGSGSSGGGGGGGGTKRSLGADGSISAANSAAKAPAPPMPGSKRPKAKAKAKAPKGPSFKKPGFESVSGAQYIDHCLEFGTSRRGGRTLLLANEVWDAGARDLKIGDMPASVAKTFGHFRPLPGHDGLMVVASQSSLAVHVIASGSKIGEFVLPEVKGERVDALAVLALDSEGAASTSASPAPAHALVVVGARCVLVRIDITEGAAPAAAADEEEGEEEFDEDDFEADGASDRRVAALQQLELVDLAALRSVTARQIDSLSPYELRGELEKRKLSKSGNKAVMAERLATMAPDVAATAPRIHFTHPVLPRESEYQASRVGNAVLWRSAAGEIRAALSARGSRHGVVCVVGFDRAGSPLLDTAHLCDRIHDMRIWAAQTTAAPQDEGGASAASSAAESAVAPRRDLRLVCGGHDKSVYVLSLDALDCGGAQQHVELLYAFDTKHSWAVHTLDVTSSSPSDGALCVTGSNSDKYVRVWRLGDKSATLLRKVGPLGREMRPRSFSVMQTRFSPNGDAIAVTNSNEFMDDTLQFILPQ